MSLTPERVFRATLDETEHTISANILGIGSLVREDQWLNSATDGGMEMLLPVEDIEGESQTEKNSGDSSAQALWSPWEWAEAELSEQGRKTVERCDECSKPMTARTRKRLRSVGGRCACTWL